jgi:hypothetical protein
MLLFACKRQHHAVTRSFYYWKTIYNLTPYEQSKLDSLSTHRIYLRLFDVDWDEPMQRPMPVAVVRTVQLDKHFEYIPVVFITQKVLQHRADSSLPSLSQNIASYITTLCNHAGITPKEIQIDCDWTANTKNIYFKLLTLLKQQPIFSTATISCTIRLNQVKYISSSGIPPVSRGMLMCYSMGNLKTVGDVNSILTATEAKKYLQHISTYPIPLDIALPLFNWCVLFRKNEFAGILHDVQPEEVSSSSLFTLEKQNLYRCVKDISFHGYNLHKDDIIRLEQPAYDDILSIADYTAHNDTNHHLNIAFFAADSITLNKYSTHELETVYNLYR